MAIVCFCQLLLDILTPKCLTLKPGKKSMNLDFVTNLAKKSIFFCDRAPQARDRRRGRSAAPRAPRGTWGSAGPLAQKIEVHFGRGTLPP